MSKAYRRSLLLFAAALSVGGCAWFGGGFDYRQSTSAKALEMPPQLSPPKTESTYAIPPAQGLGPQGGVAASAASGAPAAGQPGVLPRVAGMQLERAGPFHWLRVDAAPGVVWPRIKAFFQARGYTFAEADPRSGVLITHWKEDAHGLPKGFLGMLIRNLAASGERERYVVRLVRTPDGKATDVFLSAQGAIKAKDAQGDMVWQWQPPNPGKEATTLQALMVYLGMPKAEAKAMVAASHVTAGPLYALVQEGGAPVLKAEQSFALAWPQIGLGLDRASLVIEKQDRTQGLYEVKYVGESRSNPLQRLFGGGSVLVHGARFRIQVVPEGKDAVVVRALGADGKPLPDKAAAEVLRQLLRGLQ